MRGIRTAKYSHCEHTFKCVSTSAPRQMGGLCHPRISSSPRASKTQIAISLYTHRTTTLLPAHGFSSRRVAGYTSSSTAGDTGLESILGDRPFASQPDREGLAAGAFILFLGADVGTDDSRCHHSTRGLSALSERRWPSPASATSWPSPSARPSSQTASSSAHRGGVGCFVYYSRDFMQRASCRRADLRCVDRR